MPAADETIEIDLKNPTKAALLAWLVPGLGHIYQGRTGKGVLFAACILGTFFYGLYIGGGRVVYASTTNPVSNPGKFVERWQYACQLPVGVAAMPAYMQAWRLEEDNLPLFGDNFQRPPYTKRDIDDLFPPGDRRQAYEDHLTTKENKKVEDSPIVRHPNERAKWHHDLHFYFELGTIFTVIAGLLNVLAIYDAHSGPVMPSPQDDGDDKDGKSDDNNDKK